MWWVVCVLYCFLFIRDAIPSCDTEEFVKEAAEAPNFLQEVEECRRFRATDAAVLSGEPCSDTGQATSPRGDVTLLSPTKLHQFLFTPLEWSCKHFTLGI